jgi:glycosyltransferase involved in cell wall biosynthesis
MQSSDLLLSKAAGGGAGEPTRIVAGQTAGVDLTLVVPAHNEAGTLRQLWQETLEVLKSTDLSWEMLVVNDGSTDDTAAVLQQLYADEPRVGVISLRRQCGKAAALALGFRAARGRFVITMDGDLQDDPREIPRLLAGLAEYDMVNGWKARRRDPISRVLASRLFNFALRWLFGLKLHDINCGLKAFRREVVAELPLYGELHRFLPLLATWRGFSVAELQVHHRPRQVGRSRYGFMRAFYGLMDLATVLFLTRFRRRPAHLFGLAGAGLVIPGIAIAAYITTIRLMYGHIQQRHPLLIAGVLLIVVGVQLLTAGILGELLAHATTPADREYPVTLQLVPRGRERG